jgi:protocatechuate 3,4-dioxygenase beta subunit
MRKRWLILGVLALLAAVALVWPGSGTAPAAEAPLPALAQELPSFEEVSVRAVAQEGLTLSGRVLDGKGVPVPRAEVFLAASAQKSLGSVTCEQDGELLLACPARQTALVVQALLERGQGALTPAARTRADEEGRFRFEQLAGVSFTVWAHSPVHGTAVRERAAPGEPLELYLPPRRSVAGTVRDEAGQPLAAARVWAVSHRLPHGQQARTDASGRFVVEELGEGPFYVLASSPGLLPAVVHQVEAGPTPVHLTLAAPRTLEVEVRRGGVPCEAQVRLDGGHLQHSLRAVRGVARLEGLYPESLLVSAMSGSASSAPKRVQLREALTRLVLELEEGGRLLLTVVDEAGQPVPSPRLQLLSSRGERVEERRAGTGELAIFGPLPPGSYTLEGSAEGFKPATLPVKVALGDTPLELPMERGVTIAGRVLDVYGRPAPRISVLVQPTGEVTHADQEGRFLALVPSPGVYSLHAHHSDWGGTEQQVTAPASGVELALEPHASVEVVAQLEGRRLEGASATVWVDRESVYRSDRLSGPDGKVPMRGLPPGTYWVLATHPEHLPSERTRVTVADGQTQTVVLELKPGAVLAGEVVDERGAPVPGATVMVMPALAESTVSDAQGRFLLKALFPERSYQLRVHHADMDQVERVSASPGEESLRVVMRERALYRGRVVAEGGGPVKHFRLNDREVVSQDGRFELPLQGRSGGKGRTFVYVEATGYVSRLVERPAEGADMGDILLAPAPLLSGVVVMQGGGPVSDAVITCDSCTESVMSGADGRFSLHGPGHSRQVVVSARKGPMSASERVAAQSAGSLTLTLQAATRLHGTVYAASGAPAPGVAVAVKAVDGTAVDRGEPLVAVTGPQGGYSLEVAPGAYRLAAGMGGEESGLPVVHTPVEGAQMRVDLGPAPGHATLAVRVRPVRRRALWLVRGEIPPVANPPRELMAMTDGQLLYEPRSERVLFQGLTPGRYTLVWGTPFGRSDDGPVVRVVDVPQTSEVDLVGGR